MSDKKLSTESYKGVRDFYPEDMFIQNHIFSVWKRVAESFGYSEYSASLLEPAELYRAKSGEEIVNEQTYTFTDRGGREVTLRPEMTPTVARMVAARQHDLAFPLRWYSIPNVFRYEKPQRGRLREHWQFNVDLFGGDPAEADLEIITIAYQVMKGLGAADSDFIVKVNSRKLLGDLYASFGFSEDESHKVSKVIDKKDKISPEAFEVAITEIIGTKAASLIQAVNSGEKIFDTLGTNNASVIEFISLLERLLAAGVVNVRFDPTLMRGFDYYTGTVFEVFDTSPENNRSVFGGGRYDDLLDIFGARKIPTVGFGAGDVTARDFMQTHSLLPVYVPSAQLYICTTGSQFAQNARDLAKTLRIEGINVAVDLSGKKLGDQMKTADKQRAPYVLVIGENEAASDIYPLKNMKTGEEKKVKVEEITALLK
jgi:histidyl-tRNA synthetase